jgi:hypothetical protein
MALLRDFTLPGTSIVVPNAYHVVAKVIDEKRMIDIVPPPGTSPEAVAASRPEGSEPMWKAGNHARVVVHVYENEQARLDGKKPLAVLGEYPTDAGEHHALFQQRGAHELRFMVDPTAPTAEQAYDRLKESPYYADAVDV